MRANTDVHIALRNIGDSNDNGEFFEGPLKDGFLWLAAALGTKVMQKRFVIGIGRDKAGALAGIDLKRGGSNSLVNPELNAALDALFAGDSIEDVMNESEVAPEGGTLDTWVAPQ